jgi:thiol-disulfide isomerase/thioredoxin
MSSLTAIIAIASLLLGASIVGLICRRTQLRVRAPRALSADAVTAGDLGLEATAPFGADATLIQFSTQFCSKCPGTARLLRAETAEFDGVAHIEIDLTDNINIARQFNVLQTPTTLVLDAHRRVRSRITGAPTAAVIRDELHKIGALPYEIERAEVAS